MPFRPKTDEEFKRDFWAWVDVGDKDVCWNWKAYRDRDGYGRVRYHGKKRAAHHVAYELTVGPIPATFEGRPTELMHTCDNPACCNPNHHKLGNALLNQRDKLYKGRTPYGKAAGRYKHGKRVNPNCRSAQIRA